MSRWLSQVNNLLEKLDGQVEHVAEDGVPNVVSSVRNRAQKIMSSSRKEQSSDEESYLKVEAPETIEEEDIEEFGQPLFHDERIISSDPSPDESSSTPSREPDSDDPTEKEAPEFSSSDEDPVSRPTQMEQKPPPSPPPRNATTLQQSQRNHPIKCSSSD